MELAMYKVVSIHFSSGKIRFYLENDVCIFQNDDGFWYDRESFDLYKPVCHYGDLLGFVLEEEAEEEEIELVLD